MSNLRELDQRIRALEEQLAAVIEAHDHAKEKAHGTPPPPPPEDAAPGQPG